MRAGNESAKAEHAGLLFLRHGDIELPFDVVQVHQIVERLSSEYLVDALAEACDWRDVEQLGGAVAQLERLVGVRQTVMRDQRRDVRELGLVGAQEFLAGRNVEEQVADRDGGPDAGGQLIAAQQLSTGNLDDGAGGLLRRAGLQEQARDRRDGRQRLDRKSERRDGEQILNVAQLAGG